MKMQVVGMCVGRQKWKKKRSETGRIVKSLLRRHYYVEYLDNANSSWAYLVYRNGNLRTGR